MWLCMAEKILRTTLSCRAQLFTPTGIGNRKLCEMCSICVNKPEMMCRLPAADHFENEGRTQGKKKKGQHSHSAT